MPLRLVLLGRGDVAQGDRIGVEVQIAGRMNGARSGAAFDGKGYCWIELGDGGAGSRIREGGYYPLNALPRRRPQPLGHFSPLRPE
jgi:hypothetical protein